MPSANFSTSPPINCPGCCVGGCGTPPVSASCSLGPQTIKSDGSVTVTASTPGASGGNGSGYQYEWSTGSGYGAYQSSKISPTLTLPPNTGQSSIQYTILMQSEDSSSPTPKTYVKTCGTVTVPPTTTGTLQLLIGGDPGSLNVTTVATPVKVKLGNNFQLSWTNAPTPAYSNGNGYVCTGSAIQTSNSLPVSSNTWPTFINGNLSSGQPFVTSLSTSGVATGLYDFKISCTNWVSGTPSSFSSDTQTSDAYLRIISVSEGER